MSLDLIEKLARLYSMQIAKVRDMEMVEMVQLSSLSIHENRHIENDLMMPMNNRFHETIMEIPLRDPYIQIARD